MFIFFFSSRRRPTRSDRDWSSDVCSSDLSSSTGTPRLMLAGHIDEIGLQITHVDDEGYVYFAGIGGGGSPGLVGGRVGISGPQGPGGGGVGEEAGHLMKRGDMGKGSKVTDLWIGNGAA